MKLCFPSVNDLHEYVITHLKDYGFILEPSAKEILSQTINKVLDLECFDGYNTLNNLVDEIIYEKCSHGILEDNLIKVEDLHFFTPEGAWIRQLTQNSKAKAKMGFKMNN